MDMIGEYQQQRSVHRSARVNLQCLVSVQMILENKSAKMVFAGANVKLKLVPMDLVHCTGIRDTGCIGLTQVQIYPSFTETTNEENNNNQIIWTIYINSEVNEISVWSLVGEKEECGGDEVFKGYMDSVDGCAEACKGQTSMFAFGTNDFGVDRCEGNGCKCLCETSAKADGTCTVVEHKGYRLYRFSTSGNYQFGIILLA